MMRTGPDIGRIHNVIETYYTGARTLEEVVSELGRLMAPENYVSDTELAPIPLPTRELEKILTIVQRLEVRVSAIAKHVNAPLPDDVNPHVLAEDIRKLIDDGDVIWAIRLHRERTGAGLAEAKRAVDAYRDQKRP